MVRTGSPRRVRARFADTRLFEALQLLANGRGVERQESAVAYHRVRCVAAQDVAQELLDLRMDGLARRPVDERRSEAREWMVAQPCVLARGLVVGASLLLGERDGLHAGILEERIRE